MLELEVSEEPVGSNDPMAGEMRAVKGSEKDSRKDKTNVKINICNCSFQISISAIEHLT